MTDRDTAHAAVNAAGKVLYGERRWKLVGRTTETTALVRAALVAAQQAGPKGRCQSRHLGRSCDQPAGHDGLHGDRYAEWTDPPAPRDADLEADFPALAGDGYVEVSPPDTSPERKAKWMYVYDSLAGGLDDAGLAKWIGQRTDLDAMVEQAHTYNPEPPPSGRDFDDDVRRETASTKRALANGKWPDPVEMLHSRAGSVANQLAQRPDVLPATRVKLEAALAVFAETPSRCDRTLDDGESAPLHCEKFAGHTGDHAANRSMWSDRANEPAPESEDESSFLAGPLHFLRCTGGNIEVSSTLFSGTAIGPEDARKLGEWLTKRYGDPLCDLLYVPAQTCSCPTGSVSAIMLGSGKFKWQGDGWVTRGCPVHDAPAQSPQGEPGACEHKRREYSTSGMYWRCKDCSESGGYDL